MGEKKSKSLQDLKAAEISGLKLGAYAVQNQIDGRRLYEAKRLGSHRNRIFKRHRTPQEQASKGSRPSPQRAPKYASLGGFSTRSGRLEARRWRPAELASWQAFEPSRRAGLDPGLRVDPDVGHGLPTQRAAPPRLQGGRSPTARAAKAAKCGPASRTRPLGGGGGSNPRHPRCQTLQIWTANRGHYSGRLKDVVAMATTRRRQGKTAESCLVPATIRVE